MLNGILLVKKPSAVISKDVSRKIQKILGKVKLGHVGTLDPLAEGVLPILFGKMTRIQDILLHIPKKYVCTVEIGYETDSLDSDGEIVSKTHDIELSQKILVDAANKLVGAISQIPPLYSAIKFKGQPLYKYARSGNIEHIDLNELSRQVTIYNLNILKVQKSSFVFEVVCSSGTYVRCLARDLAYEIGTLATVVKLVRTECAGYTIDQCVEFERLDQVLKKSTLYDDVSFQMTGSLLREFSVLQARNDQLLNELNFGRILELDNFVESGRDLKVGLSQVNETCDRGIIIVDSAMVPFGLARIVQTTSGSLKVGLKRSLR